MKVLYDGFDLCAPTTSVSMTINGPAPMAMAMFLNTAIDQQLDKIRQPGSAYWDKTHPNHNAAVQEAYKLQELKQNG